MTNGDRIRSMSDTELAMLLEDSIEFFSCDECDKPIDKRYTKFCGWDCRDCLSWITKFVQSEYIPNEAE